MTIDRQHGRLIFCCDGCGETAEESKGVRIARRASEESDFVEMWAELKSEGWRAVRKLGGGWAHYCPKPQCQEEAA